MSLGEEDLGVLMKILVENIGEGSQQRRPASRRMVHGRLMLLTGSLWRRVESSEPVKPAVSRRGGADRHAAGGGRI